MPMVSQTPSKLLTLAEFLALPASNDGCELKDGAILPKVSPKRFHSKTQRALLYLLDAWGETLGEVGVEWAVVLRRNGKAWVPVPDLLFVFGDRLPANLGDEPCPVPPDLVVEIVSPDQTFSEMVEKATDYLAAGVARVWIVDTKAQAIAVFAPDAVPITYRGDMVLRCDRLPGLALTVRQVFQRAGLAE